MPPDKPMVREICGRPLLEDILVALFESAVQAEYDLCGKQREFHIPRLRQAMWGLARLFPAEAGRALQRARDPYGEPIGGKDKETEEAEGPR